MKAKIGWGMMGFLVLCLIIGLALPLSLYTGDWRHSFFVVLGTLGLGGWIAVALYLTDK